EFRTLLRELRLFLVEFGLLLLFLARRGRFLRGLFRLRWRRRFLGLRRLLVLRWLRLAALLGAARLDGLLESRRDLFVGRGVAARGFGGRFFGRFLLLLLLLLFGLARFGDRRDRRVFNLLVEGSDVDALHVLFEFAPDPVVVVQE